MAAELPPPVASARTCRRRRRLWLAPWRPNWWPRRRPCTRSSNAMDSAAYPPLDDAATTTAAKTAKRFIFLHHTVCSAGHNSIASVLQAVKSNMYKVYMYYYTVYNTIYDMYSLQNFSMPSHKLCVPLFVANLNENIHIAPLSKISRKFAYHDFLRDWMIDKVVWKISYMRTAQAAPIQKIGTSRFAKKTVTFTTLP